MTKAKKNVKAKTLNIFSKKNIIALSVVTAVLLAVICFWMFYSGSDKGEKKQPLPYMSSLSDETQVELGKLLGDTYRNIYGYYAVCMKEGASTENYAKEFQKAMNLELNMLNKVLAKDGLNITSAISIFIPNDSRKQSDEALYNDLRKVAKADDNGIKSACATINTAAPTIVKTIAEKSIPIYRKVLEPLLAE